MEIIFEVVMRFVLIMVAMAIVGGVGVGGWWLVTAFGLTGDPAMFIGFLFGVGMAASILRTM